MIASILLSSKSFRLGRIVGGLEVQVHRSCWLLAILLFLAPPITVGGGVLSAVAGGFTSFLALLVGVAFQAVGTILAARMAGVVPTTVFILPFGAVSDDALGTLPRARRLAVHCAGPSVNFLVGLALTAFFGRSGLVFGGFLISFGLFLATPCFPLPGGQVYRGFLRLNGSSDVEANRQTLELTRRCALLLALLGLLNPVLLYALFVLWVIAHLLLLPGGDLDAVYQGSRSWFRELWRTIRELVARTFFLVPFVLLTASSPGVNAASKWEPTVAQILAAQNQQEQSIRALHTDALRFTESLSVLANQVCELKTNQIVLLDLRQRRLTQEAGSISSRLTNVEAGLRRVAGLVEDLRGQTRSEILALRQEQAMARSLVNNRRQQSDREAPARAIAALRVHLLQVQRDLQDLCRQIHQSNASKNEKERHSAMITLGLPLCACLAAASSLVVSIRSRRRPRPSVASHAPPALTASGDPALPDPDIASSPQGAEEFPRKATTPTDGVQGHTPASGGMSGVVPAPHLTPARAPYDSTGTSTARPARRSLLERAIPEPQTLLARLLACAARCRRVIFKPVAPRNIPWNIGSSSIAGPVRTKNDDFCLAFESAGCQVVLVADGVSGEPLGGVAAYLACQSAAWSIVRQLGDGTHAAVHPAQVAGQAMRAASKALGRIATAYQCTLGFRTTLIIVVTTSAEYGFAYIGDGEGTVLRTDGRQERFLTAQRADGQAANLLAACLGPTMMGVPITGSLPRQPGDLLAVGTDGVFSDAVEFPENLMIGLLRGAIRYRGNLQRAVDHILVELSSAQDQTGFLFDDNMSLALLGTSEPPRQPVPPRNLPDRRVGEDSQRELPSLASLPEGGQQPPKGEVR